MNRAWRFWLPCYVWTLPLVLVGLVLAAVVYRARAWSWRDGLLRCIAGQRDGVTRIWGRPGAQTFGWLQIYASEDQLGREDLRVHETTHTVQAFLFALGAHAVVPVAYAALGVPAWIGLAIAGFVGVLGYAIAYAAGFLVPFAAQGFRDWKRAYYRNPFEIHAYEVGDRAKGWGA